MAEPMKSVDTEQLRHRAEQMRHKAGEVMHEVAANLQNNRSLVFIGLGVLAFAAGIGIWAMMRRYRSSEEPASLYSQEYGNVP